MRFTDSLCKMCRQCAAFLAFFFFFLVCSIFTREEKKWNALSVSASVGNVSCDEIFLFTGPVDWWSLFIYFYIPVLSWDWLMIIFLSWSVIEWWPPPPPPPPTPQQWLMITFYPEQWLIGHFFTQSSDWGSLLSWAVIDWWSLFHPEQWLRITFILSSDWGSLFILSSDWRPHFF